MSDLTALRELHERLDQMAVNFQNQQKAEFAKFLEHIGKQTGVKLVCVTGYTPGFNDGDPCTHSQSTQVTLDDAEGYGIEADDLPEGLSFEANSGLNELVAQEIRNLFDDVFADLIERTYGTDFRVFYVFNEDGSVDTIHKDYECGY